jgi:hypothetical protein
LAGGEAGIRMQAGNELFSFAAWPMSVELPVSYDASDPPLPREEDDEGTILPHPELDDARDGDDTAEDDNDAGEPA